MKQISCANALSDTNKNSLSHSILAKQKQGITYHKYFITILLNYLLKNFFKLF